MGSADPARLIFIAMASELNSAGTSEEIQEESTLKKWKVKNDDVWSDIIWSNAGISGLCSGCRKEEWEGEG